MKPSELIGDALDQAVAIIKGVKLNPHAGLCVPMDNSADFYSPSTDWAQGGPIIQEEKITISDCEGGWAAGYNGTLKTFGRTPLVAAMRTFVAAHFGNDTHDHLPDHLVNRPLTKGGLFATAAGAQGRTVTDLPLTPEDPDNFKGLPE